MPTPSHLVTLTTPPAAVAMQRARMAKTFMVDLERRLLELGEVEEMKRLARMNTVPRRSGFYIHLSTGETRRLVIRVVKQTWFNSRFDVDM